MTALGEIVVEHRFHGPPDSANGGYAAGRLAAHVDAPVVTVRLTAPPPLEHPLGVFGLEDASVELRDGDVVVGTARPGELDVGAPPAVTLEQAATAAARSPIRAELHPFPTCFGCGPLRSPDDALRHVCGPVEGGTIGAAPANTSPAMPHDDSGALLPEIVWAALDCPSSYPVMNMQGAAHVLGTLTARIDRPVLVGEAYVCVAWRLGVEGRKKHSASAILDADGRTCAIARALWIELRPAV